MEPEVINLPDDTTHIFRMTDCTGMFQHARYSVPDPVHGYTTDDNARALLMAALLYETDGDPRYLDLVYRYLQFLLYAWDGNWFRNFMGYDRKFLEYRGSDDCFGRSLWGLGYIHACDVMPGGIRTVAGEILKAAAAKCEELYYIRGKAYAILGLCLLLDIKAREYVAALAADLATALEANATDDWFWFEDCLTYGNAVMPFALLEASNFCDNINWLTAGQRSLDFLLKTTFDNDVFRPVGCKGWYRKGETPAMYDQQPIEACETLLACLRAYTLTGNAAYHTYARNCLAWYVGQNVAGMPLINPATGGCRDGITSKGLNENEGAESLISWHIARLTWKKYNQA